MRLSAKRYIRSVSFRALPKRAPQILDRICFVPLESCPTQEHIKSVAVAL